MTHEWGRTRGADVWQGLKIVPRYHRSHSDGSAKEVRLTLHIVFYPRLDSVLTHARATKFAANDSWGSYRNPSGQAEMNQSLSILTGANAGATEAFVVVSFELVNIGL